MKRRTKHGERGIGLVAIGIWILALAVMMAVAVDVARLAHTASEVQAIADAAALSGARALYNNGGTPGPEVNAAWAAAHFNYFDGRLFPSATDANNGDMTVDTGHFDGTTFATGVSPANAVRATPTGFGVQFVAGNLMGSFLGSTATGTGITKQAIAAFGCGDTCQPDLPIILCPSTGVQTTFDPTVPCTGVTVGPITQTPATGSSCLSCLSPGCGANTSTYLSLLPPECGGGGSVTASLGQSVDISNGQNTSVFQQMKQCIAPTTVNVNGGSGKNQHFFRVPVTSDCGNCTGTANVTNFTTLKIGCTDPNCTDRDHCACTGSDANGRPYNTYDCPPAGCHVDPDNTDPRAPTTPAVVDTGSNKGIWWARQVCDNNESCTGLSFGNCAGSFGLGLVK